MNRVITVGAQPFCETTDTDELDHWSPSPCFKRLSYPYGDFISATLPNRRFYPVSIDGAPVGLIGVERAPSRLQTDRHAKTYFLIGLWLKEDVPADPDLEARAAAGLAQLILASAPVVGLYALVDVDAEWPAAVLRAASFQQMLSHPQALKVLDKPVFRIGVDTLL